MEFIFTLLVVILWGYICYKMAEKRGRDTFIAAILGALFGVMSINKAYLGFNYSKM